MAGKNDDNIDLDEIRRMIGKEADAGQEFLLDEIINEVMEEQKKEKIEQRKKEEEENPFLFMVQETRELDALNREEGAFAEKTEEDPGKAYLRSILEKTGADIPVTLSGRVHAPEAPVKTVQIKKQAEISGEIPERSPGGIEDETEEPRRRETYEPVQKPFREREDDEPEDDMERPGKKAAPSDFDKTQFGSAEEAARYFKKREVSLYLRALTVLMLTFSSVYLTLSPTFGLPLPMHFSYTGTPFLFLFALIALLIFCMLIALDLFAAGVMRLLTFRPTLYSLVALSALSTLLHAFSIILFPEWGGYLPFTSLSCALIFFTLLSAAQKKSALRRSYKAQTLSSEPVTLKLQKNASGKTCAFRVSGDPAETYGKALHLPDPVERFCSFYVPCAVIASVVFAVLATFGQHRPELFLWALSGILTVSAPWGLLIAYSAPAKAIAKKLLSFGAGLSGFPAAREISSCRSVVLTDTDLFPLQTVSLNGVKVFSPHTAEKVLYYTGSIIVRSEMGLKKVFLDLMHEKYITPCEPDDLKFFESGGIEATVNGDHVLVGTPMFLLRMGVRLSEGVKAKNGVFVSVNGSLAGIFALKYEAQAQVQSAFRLLRRLKVTPIVAVRDFNLTPAMLENKFRLKSQWIDYPEMNDRLAFSDPYDGGAEETPAILSRDGIVPLSECISLGRRLHRAARANIAVGASGGIFGMLLMFYLSFHAAVSSATPYNTVFYLLLWLIPVLLNSFGASRY